MTKRFILFSPILTIIIALSGCKNKVTVVQPPADFTEKNATFWTSWAEDNKAIVISDDDSVKTLGDYSLKSVYHGAFNNFIRYSAGPNQVWDLTKIRNIKFSLMTENSNENAFQKVIIKIGNKNKFFMWEGPPAVFSSAQGRWNEVIIPATGNLEWQYFNTWGANLGKINFIEIHTDTWGYNPYTVWIDNIKFEMHP